MLHGFPRPGTRGGTRRALVYIVYAVGRAAHRTALRACVRCAPRMVRTTYSVVLYPNGWCSGSWGQYSLLYTCCSCYAVLLLLCCAATSMLMHAMV